MREVVSHHASEFRGHTQPTANANAMAVKRSKTYLEWKSVLFILFFLKHDKYHSIIFHLTLCYL